MFLGFGSDVIYFDVKKRIESIIGKKTIPDGYLIRLSDPPVFMVIEYELSEHCPPKVAWESSRLGRLNVVMPPQKARDCKNANAAVDCRVARLSRSFLAVF